ncbi:ornithine cyclodeaminase family protein [Streptosporangium sp. NPDC006007]|uniref:ornithine cyclodeaminase family protein n=1 Tax=Streptosporangium sp. NPDC006007 TaxID=3154575 RepID=UPI0033B3D719
MSQSASLLVLSAADVHALFGVDLAIESQRRAFTELGLNRAVLPARLLVPGQDDSVSFCYAARLSPDAGAVCKFGSVNPANGGRGLPVVSALVTVLDPEDGRPVAIMDGTSVTTIRTSAASAVAVDALTGQGTRSLAILGSGVQAGAHVRAIARVRDLSDVRIWSPDAGQRRTLAGTLDAEFAFAVSAAESAEDAVRGTDLVVCCTTSKDPVVEYDWLAPGTTVISIGSFAADRHEVSAELVARAGALVVDDVATALEDAGPIVRAISDSVISESDLMSLGEIVAGVRAWRREDYDVVYFNSVGIGVQDAAAAAAVVEAARAGGRGVRVSV